MRLEMTLLIIAMAVATYVPRILPLVALNTEKIPVFLQNVLRNVPFAILGALIFPGILMFNENIWLGIIGATTAFVAAYFGANLILVVLSSIVVLTIFTIFLI